MTLSATELGTGFTSATDSPTGAPVAYVTSSITPVTGKRHIAFVLTEANAAAAQLANLSGAGLTWTRIADYQFGGTAPAPTRRVQAFEGTGTPSAGAITIDVDDNGVSNLGIIAHFFDVAGSVGAPAIVGTPTTKGSAQGTTTSLTVDTMPTLGNAANLVLVFFAKSTNETITIGGTGWTSHPSASTLGHASPSVAGRGASKVGDNAPTASWATATVNGAVAIEFNEAGGTTHQGEAAVTGSATVAPNAKVTHNAATALAAAATVATGGGMIYRAASVVSGAASVATGGGTIYRAAAAVSAAATTVESNSVVRAGVTAVSGASTTADVGGLLVLSGPALAAAEARLFGTMPGRVGYVTRGLSYVADSVADWVLPAPSPIQEGQLLFAHLVSNNQLRTLDTLPAGWTAVAGNPFADSGADGRAYLAWKIATASEPADYTFGFSAGHSGLGTILVFTPPNASAIHAVAGAAPVSGSTHLSATLVTTINNVMVLSLVSIDSGSMAASPQFTPEAGWAKVYEDTESVNFVIAAAAERAQPAAGNVSMTWTSANPDTAIVIMVGLAPPSAEAEASVSGLATVLSAPGLTLAGVASVTGVGGMADTASVTHVAGASVNATGTTGPQASVTYRGFASVTGTGTAVADPRLLKLGVSALNGAATIAADGAILGASTAVVTGSATTAANGGVVRAATAAVAGSGVTAETHSVLRRAASAGSATSVIAAAATLILNGAASATGAAAASAAPDESGTTELGEAALTGAATTSASASIIVSVAASANAIGAVIGLTQIVRNVDAAVTGTGTLAAEGGMIRLGQVAVTGSGSATAPGASLVSGGSIVNGTASAIGESFAGIDGSASVTGTATAVGATGVAINASASVGGFAEILALAGRLTAIGPGTRARIENDSPYATVVDDG